MYGVMPIVLLALLAVVAIVFRRQMGWQVATYLFVTGTIGAVGWGLEYYEFYTAYGRIIGSLLLAFTGAAVFFGLIEFGLLRIIGLFRLGAITRITYYEALLQPFTLIVVVLGIAAIGIFGALPYFTMSEDFKMYRDVAISLAFLFTLPIMVFASTKVIDEEIENRTMLILMSKPIARWQVVLGKYFGVLLLCLGVITTLGIIAGTCAYLRYFDDMRIDYAVARTLLELKMLNLDNTKAVLAILPAVSLEFLQIAMLAAVSVMVSTRWGLALNITVTVLLYVGANLTQYAGALELPAPLGWIVSGLSHLLPGLSLMDLNQRLVYGDFNYGEVALWRGNTPSYGEIWQYVGISAVYAAFYVAGILSLGIAMFRTRELT